MKFRSGTCRQQWSIYTENRIDNKIEHLKQRDQASKRRIAEIMGSVEANESSATSFVKVEDVWEKKVMEKYQKEKPLLSVTFEDYTVI